MHRIDGLGVKKLSYFIILIACILIQNSNINIFI